MIKAKINEKLEIKFRELAMKRFGYCKEAVAKAVEEAIIWWIASVEKEKIAFEGDPIEAIDGIISDVKTNSIELQHKIKDLLISKVLDNISGKH